MTRGRIALLLLLPAVCACGGGEPIPAVDGFLRVTAEAEVVELGKAFPLTAVFIRKKDGDATEWTDDLLAPLSVRLVDVSRREDAERIEETRRYEARAFLLGEVRVPASDPPLTLGVRGVLDPGAPGPAELPGGLLREPHGWVIWAAAGALLLVGVSVLIRLGRRRGLPAAEPVPEAASEVPGPHVRALEELARLRGRFPADLEESGPYHVSASGILRGYVRERSDVPLTRTTEECLAVLSAPDSARARLAEALRHCDLAKFARYLPDAAACEAMLDAAESFVRETAPGEEGRT
jgi:hypothetical protein